MYNEASVVGGVIDGIRQEFPNVVCVDDGSSDGSQDVRCRCDQIGFELTAEADADPVERRTDVVVERR